MEMLVIIGGVPASGKTTLANQLGKALRFPVLHRDPISEALAEVLRPESPAAQRDIVPLSFAVFFRLMSESLDRGEHLVAETNFAVGISEAELQPLLARTTAVHLHCSVPYELSVRRFIERSQRGERHWYFFDEHWAQKLMAGEQLDAWERAKPLVLGIPSLIVDCAEDYSPRIEDIVSFIRSSAFEGADGS